MKFSINTLAIRRWLAVALATQEKLTPRIKLILALAIFILSFATKSLQAVDLAPVMYTAEQPFGGLTDTYDSRAVGILEGEGLLGPYDINPRRTVWISQAPGYSVFLSAIYRLTSRDYFKVQIFQNLINSISPMLIFFIAGMLISWRVGVAVGLLSALSHHLSHISNFILPDSLSALPILVAFLCFALARRGKQKAWQSYLLYAVAGVSLGIAAWLRSQTMLLGLFLIPALLLFSKQRLSLLKRTAVTALFSLLTLAPITIKNYLVYHEFVPVNIGAGIVLWEGIADVSGDRFGAVSKDEEVAAQDAVFYNQPSYAGSWAAPDGIMRDRDRVKRSLTIIKAHPFWYAGVMFDRANEMVKYSANAPLVFNIHSSVAEAPPVKEHLAELAANSHEGALSVGKGLFWMRPLLRSLQRLTKEAMRAFIIAGLIALLFLSPRRAWWFALVPIYYVLFQGFFHTEFRYTLPMQYFVFTFAAMSWVLALTVITRGIKRLIRRREVPA
jgi:hypothetical protein